MQFPFFRPARLAGLSICACNFFLGPVRTRLGSKGPGGGRLAGASALLVLAASGLSMQSASAQCVSAGGSSFTCSGANANSQFLFFNDAAVATAPGFSVGAIDNAVTIWGFGQVSYVDGNAASLVSGLTGLFVSSRGDHAGTRGSVSVATNGAIVGRNTGIFVANDGTGAISVTTTGPTIGVDNYGIVAFNNSGGSDVTVKAASVAGGDTGIFVSNNGRGATSVTATGTVIGSRGNGIDVYNASTATDLIVNAVNVIGGGTRVSVNSDGRVTISAGGAMTVSNAGTLTSIAVGGTITSSGSTYTGGTAINSGTLTVSSHADTAVLQSSLAADFRMASLPYGIRTYNAGTGVTRITTSGLVEGEGAAISASSSSGQSIIMTNTGLVRNLSRLSTSLAIETSGGPVTLTNAGGLIGTIRFGAGANSMVNNAGWNTAGGVNDFGGGTLINNAGGIIIAAGNDAALTMTVFDNLAQLTNKGVLSTANGVVGDIIRQNGGNAVFTASSILAIDINTTGQSDRFISSGTADISGSTLAAIVNGGTLVIGTRYRVLTATGGLSGRFGSVAGGTAFLVLQDSYDANNAYLDVTKRAFVQAGLTSNQISTANILDNPSVPSSLYNAILNLATDAQARNAFNLLSGEVHASIGTVLADDSRFVRGGALDRLRSAFDAPGSVRVPVMSYAPGGPSSVKIAPVERFAVWGQAFGSWGHWNGNGNAARLNRSTGGFTVGVDTPDFGTLTMPVRVGLLAGYSNTGFSVGGRSSSGSSDNYHLGIYGGTQWGAFGFRAGAIQSWHDIRTSRTVTFAGFNDFMQGNYDARTTQLFGDLGYRITMGSFDLEPFANLAYVNLRTSGFRETGGAAALMVQGRSSSVTFSTLGLRASSQFDVGGMAVTARGTLGWRHTFGAVTPQAVLAFAGGAPFAISGLAIARDAAVLEAGLDVQLTPTATIGISYNGQFARAANDQSLKGNLAVRF